MQLAGGHIDANMNNPAEEIANWRSGAVKPLCATSVADARFAKPLDAELIVDLAMSHEVLVTVEEGSVGGFGAMVLHLLSERGVLDAGRVRVRTLTLPDLYQDHDKPEKMYAEAGLDAEGILKAVRAALPEKAVQREGSVVSLKR